MTAGGLLPYGFDIPHAPGRVPGLQIGIEIRVAGRRVEAALPERAVEDQRRIRLQDGARASHQALRRRPGCDMDHVDRQNRIHPVRGPSVVRHVEWERHQKIGEPACARMGRDAPPRGGLRIARLPDQSRESRCEMDDMLARSARDLQNRSGLREQAAENGQDRVPVPGDGRRRHRIPGHVPAQHRRSPGWPRIMARDGRLAHGMPA